MTLDPEAALSICRFLHDASVMALWGAFALLWALVPAGLAHGIGRRLSTPRMVTIFVAVATILAALPLEAAAIGNGWADALDPATVRSVLFETSVGAALMAQGAAAVLLAATLVLPPRLRAGGTAAASGMLLATLALTGHAAMHEGFLGVVHRLNDAVHVLAAGAWLGALIPLLSLLRALGDRSRRRDAGIALRRFSAAGHGAVAVVMLTGVVNTLLVLGRWPTDWSSPYQAMLAAKIALVASMTTLAIFNRYVLVPRMAGSRGNAIRALRQATIAEILLGLVVVGLVSIFGLLEPS
jgi:putative copper resistance protein D